MHIYKRNMGDYARDTGHLSLLEHGAYTVMLDWCYSTERGLPRENEKLFRLCKAKTKQEERVVLAVRDEFFEQDEQGEYIQHRVVVEIEAFRAKSGTNAKSAKARWNKVNPDANGDANSMRTHSERSADGMPIDCDGNAISISISNQYQNQYQDTPKSPKGDKRSKADLPMPDEGHPLFSIIPHLQSWLRYKREKGKGYKPTGWATFLRRNAAWGALRVSRAIETAMAANWEGIFPERESDSKSQQGSAANPPFHQNGNSLQKKEGGGFFQEEVESTLGLVEQAPAGWEAMADELYEFDWRSLWPEWAAVPVSNRNEIQAGLIKKEKGER